LKEIEMDQTIVELLRYGWQGVVIAVVLLLVRMAGPALATVLPAWTTARSKREDQLMSALHTATAVMTEMVSVLQSLRAEIGAVRMDQVELRSDVEHIAEQLAMPRPRSAKRKAQSTEQGAE
jgi:hypothetical protein